MNRINVFNEIVAYIEAHLDMAIDIGLLARKCGLSVYEFRRIFSFAAGIPVNEYIRKRRLSRAGRIFCLGVDARLDGGVECAGQCREI